jgi:hypothetical protein
MQNFSPRLFFDSKCGQNRLFNDARFFVVFLCCVGNDIAVGSDHDRGLSLQIGRICSRSRYANSAWKCICKVGRNARFLRPDMLAASCDVLFLLQDGFDPVIRAFVCDVINGRKLLGPDILAASCDALFLLQDGFDPVIRAFVCDIINGRSFLGPGTLVIK